MTGKIQEDWQLLSLLAKNTINAVIVTDADNRITWVNEGFTRITGYSAEEAVGHPPGHLLQGSATERSSVWFMAEKRRNGEHFECELVNYKKDGTPFWMKMQAQPIYDETGKLVRYFGIGTDTTYEKNVNEWLISSRIEMQKEISRAILGAQETERCQIGRELHDNVNQMLASINLYLGYMMAEREFRSEIIDSCRLCLNEAIDEIRRMTKKLVSPVSKTISLRESVEELIRTLSEICRTTFSITGASLDESTLTQSCKQNLFRIIQEQFNNIIKYAAADTAKIDMSSNSCGTLLIISDDGRGFDVKNSRKGSGLINIRHRAEAFNGTVDIISSPGEGCVLIVRIPTETSLQRPPVPAS